MDEIETKFQDIYRIKVYEPTLRELMVIQSIYQSNSISDISKQVKAQPDPTLFFKVFLELNKKSLINYIAADSKSIQDLLDDKNKPFFGSEFPIFYKNPPKKNEDGTLTSDSAIDIALDQNQIRSVNMMIKYIVKYQNSFVYKDLFESNFV